VDANIVIFKVISIVIVLSVTLSLGICVLQTNTFHDLKLMWCFLSWKI